MKLKFSAKLAILTLITITCASYSIAMAPAAPQACTAGKGTCTTASKTIDGKKFSCETCKQAQCDGDRIIGTKTTSTCTQTSSAAPSATSPSAIEPLKGTKDVRDKRVKRPAPVSREPQRSRNLRSGETTKETPPSPDGKISTEPIERSLGAHEIQTQPKDDIKYDNGVGFDEADALFGKRTSTSEKSQRPSSELAAPSNLAIGNVGTHKLILSWQDNSTREYGVALFRKKIGDPSRRYIRQPSWKYIGNFQERIQLNIFGKGQRRDQDTELAPGTKYCYRMQAYFGFDKSETSDFSNTVCASTKIVAQNQSK